jgi:hypothetical protein
VGWYDVKDPASGISSGPTLLRAVQAVALFSESRTVTLNDVPAGTQLGWFLIPNAFFHQSNLPSEGPVYFNYGPAYRDAGHSQL